MASVNNNSDTQKQNKSLIHATIWSGLSSLSNLCGQLIRAKLVAVVVGPVGVAVITQLNGFLGFSQIVGGLGHATGVVRDTSIADGKNDQKALGEIHQTFFLALFFTSILAVLVANIFASHISYFLFDRHDFHHWVRVISFAIPFAVGTRFFQSILAGYRKVKILAIISTVGNLIGISLFVFLILRWDLSGAVYALLTSQIVIFITACVFAGRAGAKISFKHKFRWHILSRNIRFSAAGITVGVLGTVAGLSIVRMVIASYGEDLGGVYSAAWRFSSVYLGVIFATTTSYYFPTVSKLEKPSEIGREITNTIYLFQVILTPLIVFLIIYSEPVMRILLSGEFVQSGRLLAYQMPGDIFRLTFDIIALAFLARGRPKDFVILYTIWFVLYMSILGVANYYFHSLEAVCLAYTATYIILGVVALVVVPKFMKWEIGGKAYRAIFCASLFIAGASFTSITVKGDLVQYTIGGLLLVLWCGGVWMNSSSRAAIKKRIKR